MLDTGSSSTIIDAGFAQHHKLPILSGPMLKEVNYIDRPASYEVYEVEVEIVGQDRRFKQKLVAQTVENFSKACCLINWAQEIKNYDFMQNVGVPSSPYPPLGTLLIGVDNSFLFEVLDKRRGSQEEPIANKTPLGWAFMGRRFDSEESEEFNGFALNRESFFKSQDDFLDQMVAREFTIEHLGLQERESPFTKGFNGGPKDPASWSPVERFADDKMIVRYYEKEKFFEVSIPWRKDHDLNLTNNFKPVSLRQANTHTDFALAKKGVKISEIDNIIEGYIEKGYIEEIPISDREKGWYLPFFEVVNRHKSTPIRLVFDAKAEYRKISLNNQILNTPNRLNDLVLILLKLRQYKYAITGDISEMFLRIRMSLEDRKYHRFVHRDKHYQWTRILFGNKSSPNASQKVLTTLAASYVDSYPEACETLNNACYMDDIVDSKPTEKELAQLAKDLPTLLSFADMRLCKFYTNSKVAAKLIPRELLAKEVKFKDIDPIFESNKVLGMDWEGDPDLLTFSTKYKTVEEWKKAWRLYGPKPTKQPINLPLGLVSPVIVFPRRIVQILWSQKLDWDDPIDETNSQRWEEGLSNILKVPLLTFPRWSGDYLDSSLELHVFCDASERAFASTIYSRVTSEEGERYTSLLMTKARVSPLKNESIPRLELMACVIGTRLLAAVNLTFEVPSERIFYYTDSRNALCWISTPAHESKTYVYNRSAEIQRASEPEQWAHVATEVNPADIATRFVSIEDLKDNKIWFEGPPFLKDPKFTFKKFEPKPSDITPEVTKELKNPTVFSLFFCEKFIVFAK